MRVGEPPAARALAGRLAAPAACPASRIVSTGTRPTLSSSPSASRAYRLTRARVSAAASPDCGGTAIEAPSPPKANGKLRVPSPFIMPAMTDAPTMLTALYCPAAIALVEFSTSATPTSQPAGSGT